MLTSLSQFITRFQTNLSYAIFLIGLIWLIHGLNTLLGRKLNFFGIIPRQPFSLLLGPLLSPLLHANFNHLFYNTFPLFFLTSLLFTKGLVMGISLLLTLSLTQGLITWLIARPGIHIGASGLIMALLGYFLYFAYYTPSSESLIIAGILLYYFGSFLFSIFPKDQLVSFEGHLAGLITGVIIAHFGLPSPLYQTTQNLIHLLS